MDIVRNNVQTLLKIKKRKKLILKSLDDYGKTAVNSFQRHAELTTQRIASKMKELQL